MSKEPLPTFAELDEAYRKSGLSPIADEWFSEANKCGCPLAATYIARIGKQPQDWDDAVRDIWGANAVRAFIDGFDGNAARYIRTDEERAAFEHGYRYRLHLEARGLMKEQP